MQAPVGGPGPQDGPEQRGRGTGEQLLTKGWGDLAPVTRTGHTEVQPCPGVARAGRRVQVPFQKGSVRPREPQQLVLGLTEAKAPGHE